jgi:hypothetical protein
MSSKIKYRGGCPSEYLTSKLPVWGTASCLIIRIVIAPFYSRLGGRRELRPRMYWRETFLGRTGLIRSVASFALERINSQSIRCQQVTSPNRLNYLAAPVVVSVPVVVPVRRT